MRVLIFLWLFVAAAPLGAEPLRVFAAASLKTALDEIAKGWDDPVSLSYAGSGALARQVAAGAPADVVVLASTDWMIWLEEQGVVVPPSQALAGNTLVVIGRAGAPPVALQPAAMLEALGDQGRLVLGDIRAVPAGVYAAEALHALGLWSTVESRIAQADNVRAAMAFVARGEAPLGIVYASDALAEPRVDVLAAIPSESHAPILYPAAITSGAGATARAFLDYLASAQARDVFRAHGFTEPPQ